MVKQMFIIGLLIARLVIDEAPMVPQRRLCFFARLGISRGNIYLAEKARAQRWLVGMIESRLCLAIHLKVFFCLYGRGVMLGNTELVLRGPDYR